MEDFGKQVSEIIYSEYFVSSAMGMTGNMEDAMDLLHDAALNAFRFRDKYKTGNLHGWMYMIMRNCFINKYRLKAKRQTVYVSDPERVSTDFIEPEFYSQEEARHLMATIEKIEKNSAESIKLLLEGYPYHEIAEKLGAPIGTVKSRIFHGKKILKQIL